MKHINILGHHLDEDEQTDIMRRYHAAWRNTNSNAEVPFFALFAGFKDNELLKNLDQGPLRLYLYFGFAANNTHGDSWHSIETIADYFGKQTRTIDSWIQELVSKGLIYRTKDGKKSNTTFLVPYTDTIIKQRLKKSYSEDTQELLDDLLKVIDGLRDVYGSVIGAYHIFHWDAKKGKKPSEESEATNFLLIITKRSTVLTGHICELKNSEEFGVSKLLIDTYATFESPFKFQTAPVTGLAVNHTYRLGLAENTDTLLKLLRQLSVATPDDLKQHPRVRYGRIDDVLEKEGAVTDVFETEA